MKIPGYCVLFALLILLLASAAGCTTPQPAPAATQAPAAPSAAPQAVATPPVATTRAAASSADLDTNIRVKFNDIACIYVGDYLGSTYLYPDQKFKLGASTPSGINVNVLFVDKNDYLARREAEPKWDQVKKSWVYESVVPL